jgi:hypothetical protein
MMNSDWLTKWNWHLSYNHWIGHGNNTSLKEKKRMEPFVYTKNAWKKNACKETIHDEGTILLFHKLYHTLRLSWNNTFFFWNGSWNNTKQGYIFIFKKIVTIYIYFVKKEATIFVNQIKYALNMAIAWYHKKRRQKKTIWLVQKKKKWSPNRVIAKKNGTANCYFFLIKNSAYTPYTKKMVPNYRKQFIIYMDDIFFEDLKN